MEVERDGYYTAFYEELSREGARGLLSPPSLGGEPLKDDSVDEYKGFIWALLTGLSRRLTLVNAQSPSSPGQASCFLREAYCAKDYFLLVT